MAQRSPDQRNDYYLIEAGRAGIHKPILAALYATQRKPPLPDGETGLGIAPANRIPPDQVNTFPEQVEYAANTIRSLMSYLTATGWQGKDLWDAAQGRYTDRFVQAIAEGYSPPANDAAAARLEPVAAEDLLQAYLTDLDTDFSAAQLPKNLAPLDQVLLAFVERVPANYSRLAFQRQALLEMVRLWRKLDTEAAAIAALGIDTTQEPIDEAALDRALLSFVSQADRHFSGYPNQREALIRLVQIWRELDSREVAIQSLAAEEPFAHETNLEILDPALVAFVQRLPANYRSHGDQRFALTEGYRLWHGLDSRTMVIRQLGVDPQGLVNQAGDSAAIAQAANQLDRALLDFWLTVPTIYAGETDQRETLLRLVTIWRSLEGRLPAMQSLCNDLRQMERARRTALEAMPAPRHGQHAPRASQRGGRHKGEKGRQYMRGEICRGDSMSRYIVGDAIDFYCDGLTGRQLYWALDPWWTGGLGRYTQFPYLCHLDARDYRSRWVH